MTSTESFDLKGINLLIIMAKVALVKRYFGLLEQFVSDRSEFEQVLHPEVRQIEYPNLLNRKGQQSDFEDFLKRSEQGKKMLRKQTYNITNQIGTDDQMIVEAEWKGVMAIDAGSLKSGQELKVRLLNDKSNTNRQTSA